MRLLALSLLLAPASAFWRLPCRGRLGVERMDPIVTPGEISPHAHTIHGGHSMYQRKKKVHERVLTR